MSARTSHAQPRERNGRLGAADPELMELQDLNEDGTALHLSIRRLTRLIKQADREMDLVAAERQRVIKHLGRLHDRERQANLTLDAVAAELERLNEVALEVHREAGRRGCELQAERTRREAPAAKVVVQGDVARMEVR